MVDLQMETEIRGIQVTINVLDLYVERGSGNPYDFDDDRYDMVEYQYGIVGRYGQPMPMLKARMTDEDWKMLDREVDDFVNRTV